MIRAKTYPLEAVLPHLGNTDGLVLDGDTVGVCSARIMTFTKGLCCVTCGIQAGYWAKEKHHVSDRRYHLNLYAMVGDIEVLMTSDHIWPKSKGGANTLDNRQPMCSRCNEEKGCLTPDEQPDTK